VKILGISAFYHDSAAALIEDGRIVAAAQEERFTRVKHDANFPKNAIAFCLDHAGIGLDDVDHIAFFEKPFLKFERLLESYLSVAPSGYSSFAKAVPLWVKEKLFQKKLLRDELSEFEGTRPIDSRLLFGEHHQSHAASAFYPSPFDEAVVLTMDGVGEWTTTSVAVGRDNRLEMLREIHFPHSLGLLYSAFTYYAGFKVNSGEYKLMGLAPYGEPVYADLIKENIIDIKPDGTFRLDMAYFNYVQGLTMTSKRFDSLFGRPPRKPEDRLEPFHMDVAASIQKVTEEVVLRLTRDLAARHGIPNLCLAGGVALNCVANGHVLRDGAFENIWIQPAAGDAGGALGAALCAYHWHLDNPREVAPPGTDSMAGAYLGPVYTNADIQERLRRAGAVFDVVDDDEAYADRVAAALAEGMAVGWFQGRMEFGPRALGGRSILGDPRSADMQKTLNLKVKFRESFRPFAPSVLADDVADWFELDRSSPYMLLVAGVQTDRRIEMTDDQKNLFGIDKLNVPRSEIPAVTHVDYSARVQTVHEDTNPRYYRLLKSFKEKTGCPVIVNTSFNVRGEPIVCTPEEALSCFMGSDIDILAIGNCILRKSEQTLERIQNYAENFALD
jgi:carbamoyltransferase